MSEIESISASDFKARCLDILKRLDQHELERVVITKRGKPVAILTPVESDAKAVGAIYGFMRNSVFGANAIDLTEPVLDEDFGASEGQFHG
jgi:prevent-host-death family protein